MRFYYSAFHPELNQWKQLDLEAPTQEIVELWMRQQYGVGNFQWMTTGNPPGNYQGTHIGSLNDQGVFTPFSGNVTNFPITAGGPLPEEQEPSAAFIRAMRERGLHPLREDPYSQALWNQYQPALGTFLGQEALGTLGPQGTVSQEFDPQAFQNYLGGMTPQGLRSGAMGVFQNLLNTTVQGGQSSLETQAMTQPTSDAAFGQGAAMARQARAAQTGISPLAMRLLMPGADRAVQEFMAGGSATDVGTFYPWLKQYYGVGA